MRKVLVITYYWPPAGGPGVQRWLKFVKYLPEFHIQPVVYVPENPHYPLRDESLLQEISKDLVIYKNPIFEPYGISGLLSGTKTKRISSGVIKPKNQSPLERLMLWVRGNLFIPDARKFWVRPSVHFLKEVIQKEKIDTIITTGPPHSLHLIGLQLKKTYDIQWTADFRDPWTSIGYHKKLKLTKRSQRLHKKLEREVLNNADKIIVTSQTTKREFEGITEKPIKVITNGFDGAAETAAKLDAKFTISHIGSMLAERNPLNLWKVLSELVEENEVFRASLQLNLVGVVGDNIIASLEGYGLGAYVHVVGYVTHDEAIQYQQKSQVLLLVEIDSAETAGIIPGKLFEYMQAGRPILALGPMQWEVAEIISETATGKVFDYSASSALKGVILDWFQAYRKGALNLPKPHIEDYSRRELTRQLSEYI